MDSDAPVRKFSADGSQHTPREDQAMQTAPITVVNLAEKLAAITDHWSPRIVGQVNDVHIKVVRFLGEFPWHLHEAEDELFLVVRGRLGMEFRDRAVHVGEGEFVIVPRGVEHRPVAEEEAQVVLIEPVGTLNTGTVRNERTIDEPGWI